jgi:hypothetical protein
MRSYAGHRRRRAAFATSIVGALALCPIALLSGCSSREATGVASEAGPGAQAPTASALDPNAITAVTGGTPEVSGNVVKVNFPRKDVPIEIDGWSNVPPFMGLTSYAAFQPLDAGGVMMMGDLVLFEDEVNPVMSVALDKGLDVTALHNHFFFTKPAVYFMHIGGMGQVEQLAAGVKAVMDATQAVRQSSAAPRERFGAPLSGTNRIDAAKLDGILATKGKAQDGMYKATFGRKVSSSMCGGCSVGSAMGINTWAAFAGTDDDAVVDGDFAITEDELRGVLQSLRGGGINVVAIHSHTMGETPRMMFLHYWGRGAAADLAATVKASVDKTAWEGRSATPQ